MSLQIAYIAPKWDYGDPSRGPSYEEANFRVALEAMGHTVHPYDFRERAGVIGRDAMNSELDSFVRELRPDVAFFCLFTDDIHFSTIDGLTRAGHVTYNWFADDHWRFERFSRHFAPAFSMVSTTDPNAVPKYHAAGYSSVVLTQWAFNQHAYRPRSNEPIYDVTFVGQPYGNRPKAVRALRRAGFDVRCWGHGWEQGRLDQDDMVDVFATSRVNLNFSTAFRGRLLKRRPAVRQLKARPFEVIGSGGFLLTEETPHLERYLARGAELDVFDDIGELVTRVRHWLEHDDERSSIAQAGRRRVLAEHTYDHRFREIFRALGESDA